MEKEFIPDKIFGHATEQEKEHTFIYMPSPEQRELLAKRIDGLVEQVSGEEIRNIIFLDKSARPLATLFRDLWYKKFVHDDLPIPHIYFMHIGRETGELFKKNVSEYFSPAYLGDERYQEMLSGIPNGVFTTEDEVKKLRKTYPHLTQADKNNEKIMIIDDYTHTGESISLAKKLTRAIFPNVQVSDFLISKGDDRLFVEQNPFGFETHHAPWSYQQNEIEYGNTGVIDPEPGEIISRSYRHLDRGEKIEELTVHLSTLEDQRKRYEKTFYDKVGSLSQDIEHFVADLKDRYPPEVLDDVSESTHREIANLASVYLKQKEVALKQLGHLVEKKSTRLEEVTQKVPRCVQARERAEESVFTLMSKMDFTKEIDIDKNAVEDALYRFIERLNRKILIFCKETSPVLSAVVHLEFVNEQIQQTQSQLDATKAQHLPSVVKQLRKEMHAIADEYWKNREKSAGN